MDDNYIIKQNLIDDKEVAKLRNRKKLQFLPFWWNICTRTRPKQKALTPKPEVQFSRKIKPDITSICYSEGLCFLSGFAFYRST